MKRLGTGVLLLSLCCVNQAFSRDRMVITFKDGRVQSFDTATITKVDYVDVQQAPATDQAHPPGCWTGHFAGTDISGYAMDITLEEKGGRVEGGYSYDHKAKGQHVTAVIENATIEGNTLRGTWRQVTGVADSGRFEWRWWPGDRCATFEGTFDGIKYWHRMTRQ